MLWVQFAAVKLDWEARAEQGGVDRTLPAAAAALR